MHDLGLLQIVMRFVGEYVNAWTDSSWEADSHLAGLEISSRLWNTKVYYSVDNSLPLDPILSHVNPVHTISLYLRSILIISSHLHLGLPNGLLPLGFSIKILFTLILSHRLNQQ
jgi:hypothetical protein